MRRGERLHQPRLAGAERADERDRRPRRQRRGQRGAQAFGVGFARGDER